MKRRDFLTQGIGAGIGAHILPTIALQMLLEGRLSSLLAQESSRPPRTLIDLSLVGGAPGWFFHLPLTPFNQQRFMSNISAANHFINGQPVYASTPVSVAGRTFHMPHLWSSTIPTSNGVHIPMSSLLGNMFCLRGFENSFDNHEINLNQMFRPDSSQRSIHGILADSVDSTQVPIPSVSLNHPSAAVYRAKTIGLKSIPASNLDASGLDLLVNPFRPDNSMRGLLQKRAFFEQAFSTALDRLRQDAVQRNQKNENAFLALASAESLLKRDFGNLTDTYNLSFTKYTNLIAGCTDLDELFPEVINPPLNSLWRRPNSSGPALAQNSDIRRIVTSNSRVAHLASVFSITEFLITQNLAASVLGNIGAASHLDVPLSNGVNQDGFGFDQHFLGVALSVVSNTFTFRAIAACLHELIQVLKSKNRYDETIIRLSSEFNRAPRNNDSDGQTGTGSDHGWRGNHYALFSGAIKSTTIVGNILIDSAPAYNQLYRGTWGAAAKVYHDGANAKLNWGHAASTLAAALRVASPMPNFRPVVADHPTLGIIPTIVDGENNEE